MDLKISPAFDANHMPIKEALEVALPDPAVILEVGSGPGQHAAFLSREVERVSRWHPSEQDGRLEEIGRWRAESGAEAVMANPMALDLMRERWWRSVHIEGLNAIVSINVAHIVPWRGVVSLINGAGQLLDRGGVLYFYGPWRYESRELEMSNRQFDEYIRAQVPGAGLRVFEEVLAVAEAAGFHLGGDLAMPSNNRSIWFEKIEGE